MKNQSNTRIEILDTIRAFSALSVCLFHFVCTTKGFIETEWIRSLFSVGKFGVQSFFVISGFVIPWSMYHGKYHFKVIFKFLAKRFIRLEPPYLISVIFALVFLWLRERLYASNIGGEVFSMNQILLHFGYLIPFQQTYDWLNAVYWTLAIEFQYYFFMTLAFFLLSGNFLKARWVIYVLCLGGTFLGSDQFLPFWLPFFLLGILVFLIKSKQIKETEFFIILFLTTALIYYRYPLFSLIPVFSIVYFDQLKVFTLHHIGKFSYSLYLFHSIVGATFVNVASHYAQSSFYKFSVIVIGLLVSILSAMMVYKLIEKPSQKLSSSIKY